MTGASQGSPAHLHVHSGGKARSLRSLQLPLRLSLALSLSHCLAFCISLEWLGATLCAGHVIDVAAAALTARSQLPRLAYYVYVMWQNICHNSWQAAQ